MFEHSQTRDFQTLEYPKHTFFVGFRIVAANGNVLVTRYKRSEPWNNAEAGEVERLNANVKQLAEALAVANGHISDLVSDRSTLRARVRELEETKPAGVESLPLTEADRAMGAHLKPTLTPAPPTPHGAEAAQPVVMDIEKAGAALVRVIHDFSIMFEATNDQWGTLNDSMREDYRRYANRILRAAIVNPQEVDIEAGAKEVFGTVHNVLPAKWDQLVEGRRKQYRDAAKRIAAALLGRGE